MHTVTMEFPEDYADKLSHLHPDGLTDAIKEAVTIYMYLGQSTLGKLRADSQFQSVPISAIIKQSINAPRLLRTRQTHEQLHDRNARIIEAIEKGENRAMIAAKYKLSLIRIHQIYSTYKARKQRDAFEIKEYHNAFKNV